LGALVECGRLSRDLELAVRAGVGGAEGAGYHQISSLESLHKGTTHAHHHDRDTVGK
jgi:hypothetical protein